MTDKIKTSYSEFTEKWEQEKKELLKTKCTLCNNKTGPFTLTAKGTYCSFCMKSSVPEFLDDFKKLIEADQPGVKFLIEKSTGFIVTKLSANLSREMAKEIVKEELEIFYMELVKLNVLTKQ